MRKLLFVFISLILFSSLRSQIVVDGSITESQYVSLATKQNNNQGFGPDIDVTEILYYADVANSKLYLAVRCKLNTNSNDGIGLWLNFSELTGAPAGTALGGSPGGHYMNGNNGANINFKADFEVDYMFAWNPGNSTDNCYVDAVKLVGGSRLAEYLGNCGQSGTATTNSGGDIFTGGSVTFAFRNDGGNNGFEISIPFSQLGVTSAGKFAAFAFVVSATAYFSDVTVPGNITTGNPGFDVNFGTLSGGPYHAPPDQDASLPVFLSSLTAIGGDRKVILSWATESEVGNLGFEVSRADERDGEYVLLSSYESNPELRGQLNSGVGKRYTFIDRNVRNGQTYWYKLISVSVDGARNEYGPISATPNLGIPDKFRLEQNYPNPFNPGTKIVFDLPERASVKLKVYDLLGREVKTLVDGDLGPGRYELDWDGTDGVGNLMSSGVYFYRLEAFGEGKSFVETKKMVLLR